LKVLRGGGAKFAAEHGDEGAGVGVAEGEGGLFDALAGGEEAEGLLKAAASKPLAESHACFFEEEPFEGAAAGAGVAFGVTSIRGFCEAPGAVVFREGELERDGLEGFDFVFEDGVEAFLGRDSGVEGSKGDRAFDEFAEERS
jgi:hypothetical protein